MAISAINSVSKAIVAPFNKVVPQPRMIEGLPADTFQKSKVVTDTIKSNKPTAPMYLETLERGGRKGGKKNGLPPEISEKVNAAINNMKSTYGKELETVSFDKDIYTPNDMYVLKGDMKDASSVAEYYDKDMNKVVDEKTYLYQNPKGEQIYLISKMNDYRNNSTTKVRMELDKDQQPIVTDEVRIIRDKDNKIVRKEMMTHSEVDGAYDQKYVYPDGTEKVISSTKKYKKFDGMEVIKKSMESLDGTKTEYRMEQDNKGNKILEYKITDKDGKELMNLNKTMERVGDNKVISSNGNKVFEMTFDTKQVTIQERGKEEKTTIVFDKDKKDSTLADKKGGNFRISGQKSEMIDLLKKMPAEQLMAFTDTVKNLKGVQDTNDCCMWPDKKQVDTINDLFSVLHEGGHAIDFRKSTPYQESSSVATDKELRKVYSEEKEAFNKAFPNAQREHVGYFIQVKDHYAGKWGGLGEVVAEANALRDSYTVEGILAPRVQYLQQYYPKTIAYLNDKLGNYKAEDNAKQTSKV